MLPDDGQGRPGVRIAAEPQSLVTAPITATLLFHGDLLDYGNVVILEPAANILFVIAGLDQAYGTVGQILPKGTPIGLMGGQQPRSDNNLTENIGFDDTSDQQTLYLEVRDGQTPTNPDAWFALE